MIKKGNNALIFSVRKSKDTYFLLSFSVSKAKVFLHQQDQRVPTFFGFSIKKHQNGPFFFGFHHQHD
jgi:hypothetical protein